MKKHHFHFWLTNLLAAVLFACQSTHPKASADKQSPNAQTGPGSPYQKLIQKAYLLKKDGHNARALALFDKARAMAPKQSNTYASALDDQASVLLRMGRTDEAARLYKEAIALLRKIKGNDNLRRSIERRLTLVKQLKERGITCAEPGEPLPGDKTPYFPDVPSYQEALGQFTLKVASCLEGTTIEPIQMRLLLTGDGQLINAHARNKFAGTPVEKCVVERLEELIPKTQLPKFRACFRGFTYSFMLGPHPDPLLSADATNEVITPKENLKKGDQPDFQQAKAVAAILLEAYKSGDIRPTAAVFFPVRAFDIVKDSPNPRRYYKQLVRWFNEDMQEESKRFKGANWQLEKIEPGLCKWKAPGTEANKIGYWSCRNNRVTTVADGETRIFEINVMINWGTKWYITHLRPPRS